nr:hypothetical protein [Desulfobacteraceae bacterium]
MTSQIIIYSGDVIRGHIIQKKLAWHDIRSLLFHKIFEAHEAISKHAPFILIIDTVVDYSRASLFLQTVSFEKPTMRIVILAQAKYVSDISSMTEKKHTILADPIHPDRILTLVRNWLADFPMDQKQYVSLGKTGALLPIGEPPFFLRTKKNVFQRLGQFFRQLKQGK